ncbi:MAG TPA: class I SAM-dependent methyltransferase [Solirubrobacteraceae bacterium]|jgi:SAM-dependent methyltransferase|nr:class I SAM-dependent methyltransferase [Solirubrobacteraceae bacterium]
MGLTEKLRELRWRAAGHYSRRLPDSFVAPLAGGRALEIGGPSALFGSGGLLPVYPILASIDGVQWAEDTAWHSLDADAGYSPEGERRGELHVIDRVDLDPLADASYDVVLSSHVLEHIANPLRALTAWRRVTRPGGHLLIVLPHMAGTFDHRRPVTAVGHMVEDFERDVGEDDLTHLDETLRLHDRARDVPCDDDEAWAEGRRRNLSTRLIHHHTFTTSTVLALLDHIGLELAAVETRFPHDIYVLGRWPSGNARADNSAFLASRHRSPFRVDRKWHAAATPSEPG